MTMLKQNSELRPHRIWNWTLPAWYATLSDGKRFMTCPSAGICAQFCYARNGTYMFKNVLSAHKKNLEHVLQNPDGWKALIVKELQSKRFRPTGVQRELPIAIEMVDPLLHDWVKNGGAAVRIHDSGDFFADWYYELWIEIATLVPDVLFYAYTKEVEMTRGRAFPRNFRVLFSTGGTQDKLIDPEIDRHADVFPNAEAIAAAGYESQDASDLLAILLPTTKIGISANRIPHFNKRLAGRRFSEAVPVSLRMKEKEEK